jgi:hypothetical protein
MHNAEAEPILYERPGADVVPVSAALALSAVFPVFPRQLFSAAFQLRRVCSLCRVQVAPRSPQNDTPDFVTPHADAYWTHWQAVLL